MSHFTDSIQIRESMAKQDYARTTDRYYLGYAHALKYVQQELERLSTKHDASTGDQTKGL